MPRPASRRHGDQEDGKRGGPEHGGGLWQVDPEAGLNAGRTLIRTVARHHGPSRIEQSDQRHSTGSWGLGVVEAEDEDELRAFAADHPAVVSGTAQIELGKMLAGHGRPRGA